MILKNIALDIQRALLLLWVILKYGIAPMGKYLFGRSERDVSYAVLIRLALEELGLTYLKLGQFLATRFDILPMEVCRELNKLFDDVTPVSFETVKTVIESELQGPLEAFFLVFNREPIAAASVAQVHEAQTRANERVAVKIQRPGIERVFATDMRNLRRFVALVDVFDLLPGYSAKEAVDEFTSWTQQEMDFTSEGRVADRLRKNALPYEVVPHVHWDLTTSKVLTMEYIEGMSLAQVSDLLDAGEMGLIHAKLPHFDVKQLGDHLSFVILRQLFVTGFFHGDPHPGNILICDNNTIALVDFGIFGELTDEQREIFVGQVENIALGNINESFQCYAKQYIPTDETDLRAFEQDGKSIFRRWYQTSLNPYSTPADRHIGKWGKEMLDVARKHRLRARVETLLFWRALYALDYSALRLSEYFDIISTTRNFFKQIRPGLLARVAEAMSDQKLAIAIAEQARGLPDALTDVLKDLPRRYHGGLLYIKESPEFQRVRDRETKWLVLAILGISLAVCLASVPHDIIPIHVVVLVVAIPVFISLFKR